MKGQKLMKHSNDLIGEIVHVYRMDWKRPEIPRAGQITGFGPGPGLFEVTISHSWELDIRNQSHPHGFLPGVLLVDDPDSTPVGVHEYARLKSRVHNSSPDITSDQLVMILGETIEMMSVEQLEQLINEKKKLDTIADPIAIEDKVDKDQETEKSKAPAVDNDPLPPSDDDEPKEDKVETPKTIKIDDPPPPNEVEEPEEVKGPGVPRGNTPIKILMNSEGYEPIKKLDKVMETVAGENELLITIVDDDKPIARITYRSPVQDAEGIMSEPWGFTIKLRDSAGRCSRVLAEYISEPEQVAIAIGQLAGAVNQAKKAKIGDWGSSAANMTTIINQSRVES